MDVRLLFPNLYLSAADFQGKPATLTITRLTVEDLRVERGGTEKKAILYFDECATKARKTGAKEKRLVLNKTNAKAIGRVHGWEANDWPGKKITLYPTTCQAFGETVDCIRVRAPEGQPSQEASYTAPVFDGEHDEGIPEDAQPTPDGLGAF